MKKRFLALFLAFVCVCSAAVSSFAAETRSSSLISKYSTAVSSTSGGVLNVKFSVTCDDTMTTIGAKSISIYKKAGSAWSFVKTYSESYSGMTKSNAVSYSNTISHSATSGIQYKVVVTVLAKNSSGSDTRTETHYVTAK